MREYQATTKPTAPKPAVTFALSDSSQSIRIETLGSPLNGSLSGGIGWVRQAAHSPVAAALPVASAPSGYLSSDRAGVTVCEFTFVFSGRSNRPTPSRI